MEDTYKGSKDQYVETKYFSEVCVYPRDLCLCLSLVIYKITKNIVQSTWLYDVCKLNGSIGGKSRSEQKGLKIKNSSWKKMTGLIDQNRSNGIWFWS